jgi:Mg2+ and Co2+ transporter CorA
MATLSRFVPGDSQHQLADIVDQFERLDGVADAQKEYLEGVIEFYRTRTETKMTIAAERLAVIAVVTLPITALSSIYGMNLIVNDRTDFPHLEPSWVCWRLWSAPAGDSATVPCSGTCARPSPQLTAKGRAGAAGSW